MLDLVWRSGLAKHVFGQMFHFVGVARPLGQFVARLLGGFEESSPLSH